MKFTYLPEFLSKEKADTLFNDALTLPWEDVGNSRKACFVGEDFVVPYHYSDQAHIHHPVPAWLGNIMLEAGRETLKAGSEFLEENDFNGCLINYYPDGDYKMGWHSDLEDSLEEESPIGILSTGAERSFSFKSPDETRKFSVPLVHGSLLIMDEEMRKIYKHAIIGENKVRVPRISFTFRVLKRK